ncbi:hypothetical protein DE146DRAFT_297032 [Phaeosphaeria sp. MPI-PUGE-AT-0046c]|nr:hypothetical protein DE146DRAFT_297032 [Phaeosphaeria sp. MPI-PUGE-AT-0046c]
MFTPSFARAVRSTAASKISPAGTLCRAALSTASTPFQPLHNRRYSSSSSKPSIPPKNKKKPVAELEQNAAKQLQDQAANAKAGDKVTEMPVASSSNSQPHVPATTHLSEDDVRLSSFFTLHGPLPYHHEAWQQSTSQDMIEAIFQKRSSSDSQSMQKTEKTLGEFVRQLYADLDAQGDMLSDAVFYVEEPHELDAAPTEESIMRHAMQLPHFTPPPPPVASEPYASQDKTQRASKAALPVEPLKKSASFRAHVHQRRRGMLLISVKRQRKLKMKKHKYKKLMKRTRLERRKLDRT